MSSNNNIKYYIQEFGRHCSKGRSFGASACLDSVSSLDPVSYSTTKIDILPVV